VDPKKELERLKIRLNRALTKKNRVLPGKGNRLRQCRLDFFVR